MLVPVLDPRRMWPLLLGNLLSREDNGSKEITLK